MSLGVKVAETLAKKKAGAKSFHAAYKKAPGETMGTYAKNHRWGVGLTAASLVPLHLSTRQSSHTGVDTNRNYRG